MAPNGKEILKDVRIAMYKGAKIGRQHRDLNYTVLGFLHALDQPLGMRQSCMLLQDLQHGTASCKCPGHHGPSFQTCIAHTRGTAPS